MRFVPHRIHAAIALTVFATAAAAEPLPQSAREWLERRGGIGRGTDVFGAPSWVGKTRAAEAPPAVVAPAPPKPPPLPFGYGGSGRVNGKRVLFLERDNHSSLLVQVGDIVDGTYRVDALDPNRAVLRYLPMNIAQVMVFGSPETTRPLAAAIPPRIRGPLIVDVPDEVPMDREVAVVLGIPPGSLAAKATVQFNYDENALSVTGAKIVRPGRAVVEVSAQDPAPSKELRLKALDTQASSTEIGIDIMAVDAQGQSLAVKLPPHHVSLVEAVN
jgi:hypothetical protein